MTNYLDNTLYQDEIVVGTPPHPWGAQVQLDPEPALVGIPDDDNQGDGEYEGDDCAPLAKERSITTISDGQGRVNSNLVLLEDDISVVLGCSDSKLVNSMFFCSKQAVFPTLCMFL